MGDHPEQSRVDRLAAEVEACNELADQVAFLLGAHIERLASRLQERDEDVPRSA